MFYNSRRITKSSLKEINDRALSYDGKKTIDNYQKLKDFQKKEKFNDCLLVRCMKKFGIKQPKNELQKEIDNYMKQKRLRKLDLKNIRIKINNLIKSQKTPSNKVLKSTSDLFQNNINDNINENTKQQLTEINNNINNNTINNYSTLSPRKTKLTPINKINPNNNTNNDTIQIKTIEPNNININNNTISQNNLLSQENSIKDITIPDNKINQSLDPVLNPISQKKILPRKKIYLKPEEELAELEKELGFDQEAKMRQKRYERFYKYFSEGNEWEAIYKYNNEMYEKELEEEKRKKLENKKILKEELEKQIKDKTIKEYNEYLENEKYKKMFNENQNKLAQIEKEKEELKQKKLNMEKMAQKEQMKNKKIMDRIAFLKEKKFEKNMLNNIKLELEKEKKFQEEKKLKNFLEMKKIIQDSESRINQKRLEKQKQNELAKLYTHDSEITEKIKENERTKILNKIKSVGDYHQNDQTKKILEKMQKELEEEDKKLNEYFKTRKQIEDMKEEQEKKRKIKIRQELRNYLDNQIEEKKREKLFEKMLIREQGRIWDIDAKKYNMEQKIIEDKIKMNNIKNGEILRQQIENNFKRKMKKNSMSSAEYSLNKQEINKIIDSMETQKEKQKEKIN